MDGDNEYDALLNLFIKLVQSQAEVKIDAQNEWLAEAQSLSVKLFYHLTAMLRIGEEITVDADDGVSTFIDHASVKVLTRAAFETYLVLYYIYVNDDCSLSEFRHDLWYLGGLCERQKIHAAKAENLKQLADEKIEIEKLTAKIIASPHSKDYSQKQLTVLLKGKWRGDRSWGDLAEIANFHTDYFNDIYGFLCGYSHASYISALQVGQAKNSIEDQKMLSNAILQIGTVLMAHFAFAYPKIFPGAEAVLEAMPTNKNIAEIWRFEKNDS